MTGKVDMSAAHILVIDDDERLRDLLQRFLSESGFLVTAAGSAEAVSYTHLTLPTKNEV